MRSIVVNTVKGSYISKMLGSKKGVIIPFPMVQSIGDVILIKHISDLAGEAPPVSEQVTAEE